MDHLIYLVKVDLGSKPLYDKALREVGAFDAVAVDRHGLSSAFGRLADELLDGDGRILPGLRARHPGKCPSYLTTSLVTFSAGYKLAERLLGVPEDLDEVDAYVALDSIHADFEDDDTASDTQIAPFVELANRAKAGEKLFWIGHTDVRTPQTGPKRYASTTQVAQEIVRLARGTGGLFRVQAFNLETSDFKEHTAALVKWGPGFVADAMRELLRSRC